MKNLIPFIKEIINLIPKKIALDASFALLLLVFAIIFFIIASKILFYLRLKKLAKKPELVPFIKSKYKSRYLLRRSSTIENISAKFNPAIINLLGMNDIWISNLVRKKKKDDLVRSLKYSLDKCLHKCFLLVLEKKVYAPVFLEYLEKSDELYHIRKLAISGNGAQFDSESAYEVLKSKISDIRDLTGDPEWISRDFAVSILLHDKDDKTSRALWEAFNDSESSIRKKVIINFDSDERERLYKVLYNLFTLDPMIEIRKASWERIQKDFIEFYSCRHQDLSTEQAFHILELLRENSKDDENLALFFLESRNLELRLAAAKYLDKAGALRRLCIEVDLGDRAGLERNFSLLKKAALVNVTSFLSCIDRTDNPATLLLCAKILRRKGGRFHIFYLAKKVFMLYKGSTELLELFRLTLECIRKRGDEKALRLLLYELYRRKNDENAIDLILNSIPRRGDFIFIDALFQLLKDKGFARKKTLSDVLLMMPKSLVLPELFHIIKDSKNEYHHSVKIDSLRIMGRMELHYCLQTILENLHLVRNSEAGEFAMILSAYPKKIFKKKVEELLSKNDAKIRASIIASLPVTQDEYFVKHIRSSMKDSDPEVRIASIWSLVNFKDYSSLSKALDMLRDPVERVRIEAGKVAAEFGANKILEELKKVLYNANEILPVKQAVIKGLGFSQNNMALEILVDRLEFEEELQRDIIDSLSLKSKRVQVEKIIEKFKKASPKLRERIKEVFKVLKENNEEILVELLKENNSSLNGYIIEILESTGFVEEKIRKLYHKDSEVRREAAEFLTLIGTKKAYKGIILASRDPDNEVRVKVAKALEKLGLKESRHILNSLENDPDKRIRKYTFWALERLKSKSL